MSISLIVMVSFAVVVRELLSEYHIMNDYILVHCAKATFDNIQIVLDAHVFAYLISLIGLR